MNRLKKELDSLQKKNSELLKNCKRLETSSSLVDGLRKNPLPASFEILFKDVRRGSINPREIKQRLEDLEGVDGRRVVDDDVEGVAVVQLTLVEVVDEAQVQ